MEPSTNLAQSLKKDKDLVANLLKSRMFVIPSFEIYGGVGGLYDFGPAGCAVKNNVEQLWRSHFILEENMLEVSTSCLTPEVVLKNSGHCAKFEDIMVRDSKNSDLCYRVDKLIEDKMEKLSEGKKATPEKKEEYRLVAAQADAMSIEELKETIAKYKIVSPDTGNPLTEPFPFNLMFGTPIGPTGHLKGYLRPETAQGQFVNFRRLLEYNGAKMPFASAQIGLGFRNEIAPRAGLLRVREFQMAEIEHYVHPKKKNHPKFGSVAELKLPLLSQENQLTGGGAVITDLTVGGAVETKLIENQTLAYFMSRTFLFLMKCGINPEGVRFRQHLPTEMAHYASDCWDAEILTSYGWVECVGHADRACFDLSRHTEGSKVELMAAEPLDEPVIKKILIITSDKKTLGKLFKKGSADILETINSMNEEEKTAFRKALEENESYTMTTCKGEYELKKEMFGFEETEKTVKEEKFFPSVIEPAFGIGRILYSIFEHSFKRRDGDEKRTYLNLRPGIAPVKCSILPLISNEKLNPIADRIRKDLLKLGVSTKIDMTGTTIGKRYARTDQIGIPFGITVDFESLEDNAVTLREVDTAKQRRVPINDVADVVRRLSIEEIEWLGSELETYPWFTAKEE
eukprot:CAMPEP_0114977724 /NCGR_PEP_ID=MMETSP0216-20121206/3400_1 /TAXON_ID=223996 /ORGANISM="Protocruzia adherens, Strain Boccale" /LENGTH=627 /DNA_ID=CAMNT_0002338821 /DNA_START=66 /DNA_END=1949 /DNA_ORIENTATION=-